MLLKVIARMDGTPFPDTARLTGRWFRGRLPPSATSRGEFRSCTARFAESPERRKAQQRQVGLETAYCAETVAITYEEMGLLTTEKRHELVRSRARSGVATRCR